MPRWLSDVFCSHHLIHQAHLLVKTGHPHRDSVALLERAVLAGGVNEAPGLLAWALLQRDGIQQEKGDTPHRRACMLASYGNEQGDLTAKAVLGFCYLEGLGCPTNLLQAQQCASESANQGNAWGMFVLGHCLKRHSASQAMEAFEKAARAGDTGGWAYCELGKMKLAAALTANPLYAECGYYPLSDKADEGIPDPAGPAKKALRAAIAQNNAEAMWTLSRIYQKYEYRDYRQRKKASQLKTESFCLTHS